MSIPGLGTLKTWGMGALALALAITAFLLQSEKLGRTKDKLKGEIQARKTGKAANKAVVEGMNREQTEINKASNPSNSNRDGFE